MASAALGKIPFPLSLTCDNVLYHTLMNTAGNGINELIIAPSPDLRPAPLFAPTRKAARRFLEFFTAQINNAHTRRAYVNATRRFADWCASKDIHELAQVQPFHVAAFVQDLQELAAFRKTAPGRDSHAIRLARDRTCYRH
jgi:hypothetical protein